MLPFPVSTEIRGSTFVFFFFPSSYLTVTNDQICWKKEIGRKNNEKENC